MEYQEMNQQSCAKNDAFHKILKCCCAEYDFWRTVLIAFAIGVICHFSAYTNIYLGHDASSFWNYNSNWDIVTGRYVGTLVKELHGSLQAPWMIGMISNLLLALGVGMMVRILSLKKMLTSCMVAAVVMTWPTITSSHGYLYMLSQFSMAMLLSIAAVYTVDRNRYGWVLSILFLVMSLACYQAYIGLTAGLMLLRILRECEEAKRCDQEIIRIGIKYLAILGISLVIYYSIWKCLMEAYDLNATNYKNMDQLGLEYILNLLLQLDMVYNYVFRYFFQPDWPSYIPSILKILMMSSFLVFSIRLFYRIIKKRKAMIESIASVGIAAIVYLLFPLAMNAGQFLSGSQSYAAMEMAFSLPILFVLQQVDDVIDYGNIKESGGGEK